MLFALAPAALAALTLIQQIDSTVPVERGQRLEVDLFAGDVDVKTWTKNAVRVVADPDGRGRVEIERSATSLSVRTTGRRGPPSSTDIQITVPAWMALDISGVYSDITIAGARGPITAETVQGDVSAEGGEGLVSVKSVQGGGVGDRRQGADRSQLGQRGRGSPSLRRRDLDRDGERRASNWWVPTRLP